MMRDLLNSLSVTENARSLQQSDNDKAESAVTTSGCVETRNTGWNLVPMLSRDLRSSDLGEQLKHALQEARKLIQISRTSSESSKVQANSTEVKDGSVVFLGMDAPELPLEDIAAALSRGPDSSQHKSFAATTG